MKQMNTELPAYILLSVFAVILIGVLIYNTKLFYLDASASTDKIVSGVTEISEEYADYDITIFDGEEVRGAQVVNFIKNQLGDYSASEVAPIYVQVQTTNSGISYSNIYQNQVCVADIKNFLSTQYYIKPTAMFTGEVIKSANKAVLGVKFVQK